MQWESDRDLRKRMLLALALVAVMPVAFVATMTAAFNVVVVPLAERLLEVRLAEVHVPLAPVFGLTLLGMALCWSVGDRLALRSVGASHVTEDAEPELHARVQRLAATAGVPKPDVAVIDTEVPNAFATGRSKSSAAIAVTTGLVESLDGDQLDAVLAHELAHVRNRDATVMTVAFLLPTFTYYVSKIAYHVLAGGLRVLAEAAGSSRRRSRSSNDGKGLLVIIVLFVVTMLVTITVSALFWAASFLLFRILSRYREYAADRGAAAITGEPLALATALNVIDGEMQALPDRDLRELDGGVEALYVSPLDLPMFTDDDPALLSQDLFPETHPPTRERIEYLQALAGQVETGRLDGRIGSDG